jgi:predicted aconitase
MREGRTLQLTFEEEKMLYGEMGEAVKQALQLQMDVGSFFGAKKFVPINNAHMMGDIEVMGDGGFEFLQKMAELDARCMVNTTTNARCFDFEYVEKLNQDSGIASKEKKLISFLQEMKVMTTDTCINYQTLYQPHMGEHVAWGDTGTVIYANSVLGARSNFESGPAAFAAALTGRVPAYGFHLEEHRKGTILVKIEADLLDLADWGAIGKLVGEKHQNYFAVPVFTGIKKSPSADELKHLGASLASYGSMGMFHMVGVTPEAQTVEDAFGGNEPVDIMTITNEDMESLYADFDIKDGNTNLIVFSGPQLSLYEMKSLSELLEGKKVKKGTSMIITTNNGIKSAGEKLGYVQKIEEAGGMILEGVCFYILHSVAQMRIDNGWSNLVTNSAKLANIVGAHKFNSILRRTEDCVKIAVTGRF